MEAIHKERLLKLADFLDTIPEKSFYFGSWVENWKGEQAMSPSCGTTACAFGWATAIPEFQALGLRFCEAKHGGVGLTTKIGEVIGEVNAGPWPMTVQAAEDIFGLSERDMRWLFTPCEYTRSEDSEEDHWSHLGPDYGRDDKPYEDAPPSVVAEHIRTFVERT
jgi:hypothetical protein